MTVSIHPPRCQAVGSNTGDPCIGITNHKGGHPYAPEGRETSESGLAWLLEVTGMPREQIWTAPADQASGYTSHGWPYGPNPPTEPARVLAKCGGPGLCWTCRAELPAPVVQSKPAAELPPAPVGPIEFGARADLLPAVREVLDDPVLVDIRPKSPMFCTAERLLMGAARAQAFEDAARHWDRGVERMSALGWEGRVVADNYRLIAVALRAMRDGLDPDAAVDAFMEAETDAEMDAQREGGADHG